MSRRRKIGRWIAGVLLTPIILVLLLIGALYLPPVQQWAVNKVCAYASEETGMDIRLKRIRIKFPLDLDLQEFSATTPPDTVMALEHVIVDLDLSRIFKGHVGVDALDLQQGVVDTRDLIATVRVKGKVGNFHLNSEDIHLKEQRASLTGARLDNCDVDIAMRDTTVVDTTESAPLLWSIGLGDIEANDTRVAFHTIGDSICIRGGVKKLAIKGGDIDLGRGIYKVDHLHVDADSLSYDTKEPPLAQGLDYNHLSFRPLHLDADNIFFQQDSSELSLTLNECSGKEQSGLQVDKLCGHVRLDDTHIQVPDLQLKTPQSHIDGRVDMDWSSLSSGNRGTMDVDVDASVAKEDLLLVTGNYLTPSLRRSINSSLPNHITLSAKARGNVDRMVVERGVIKATPMAEAQFSGVLTNLLDSDNLGADLNMDMQTTDLSPVRHILNLPSSVRLPQMSVKGKANMQGSKLLADLHLTQGRGTVDLKGNYDTKTEDYDADIRVRNLNLHNFLPKDSLYTLTGRARISGRGTDLLSKHARAKANVEINHLRYGHNDLDNIRLLADVKGGKGLVNLYSNNDLLRADACATLQLDKKITAADISLGATYIDLHRLGLVDEPLAVSMVMDMEGSTNLSDTHRLQGSIRAIELMPKDTIFYPTDIDLNLLMSPDTLFAQATSGDLELELHSSDGYEQLLDKANLFTTELKRQLADHHIAQDTLTNLLPRLDLRLKSGNQNTMANIVQSMGYDFDQLYLVLNSDPELGVNGQGYLHSLNTGAIMLDTIQWNIYQDSTDVVRLGARVKNGPRNKQVVFESKATAELTPTGADASLTFFDAKGRKGVDFGAQIFLEDEAYRLHLYPLNPVIAYRRFTLNDNNYILLHDNKHVEADIDLLADDGTGFKLYSTPNADALQDITLSVHDFNLGELSSVIPYMPSIGGMLAGDFHLVQDEQSMSVLVDANVRDFAYENAQMGNVGLNAVYLPNADGTHYVDGIVSQDGNEVMLLAGTYNPKDEGTIDAKATLQRLPLRLANGFIPDQIAELRGYVTGEVDVTGHVSNPMLDGTIVTDSMYLVSDMYSLSLRFPDDSITVRKSRLDLNRIEAYSTGRNPLVLDGTIDLRDLSRIGLNLNLSARDFELINAPKNQRAVAYGKVYVNVGARLTGTLNDMLLRGKLDVLGNTDVTYVLTDSPLTVEDQLAELVTFADFSDTLTVAEVEKASPQNIDMLMDIGIEQAAQVHCLLSVDGTNHIDLEGGGNLTMTYTTQDGMHMYGRYTIISGMMNYSLMVMSLKNFAIDSGSYAEFTGDLLNPKLNISASERVKTTVYENNVPRSVNFDVGLKVTQTLENMGLEFTLEAPGDMTISNQLATMSPEERGKVAVTMLATGMYLTESGNGTSGFSATNALNSFLQTQIAAISNRALSTIDLNFGVDNTSTASGGTQTDYSFSFAKRFWGNRISLIIGGKVSSGSEAVNTGESIINNISLEYRLDKSATRYVRIYYDRDTESLLEGDIMEMGAGLVLRKKSNRLGELFIFKKASPLPTSPEGKE
ncbi:MAG: translocation/assembly module TamB domain-containing protein [Bacteroidaceae bacterium]|nr:translocation/assembly module TamB domain-containing protein [Bacteroidaceae bacterium]